MAVISALALGACGDHASEGKDCPEAQRAKTVSGFCVPRWVSLKRGEVYGRKGPGKDYPAIWVYRVQGLPVQIVAETEDWRKICDPLGGSTWVHRSMVDGRRTIMSQAATPAPLLREPKAGAPVEGLLNAKALAAIDKCKDGWCKVSAGGVSGWLTTDKVWGLAPAPQCR